MNEELLKKAKSKKKRRMLVAIVLIAFAAVSLWGIKIHRDGGNVSDDAGYKSIKLEIRCDQLSENRERLLRKEITNYIPKDGVILKRSIFKFKDGDSVYDALHGLCSKNKIHLDSKYDTIYKSHYIKGINHIYEKDAGKRSGWLYMVNKKIPDYGMSKVKLKNGDEILVYYTVDYTNDNSM